MTGSTQSDRHRVAAYGHGYGSAGPPALPARWPGSPAQSTPRAPPVTLGGCGRWAARGRRRAWGSAGHPITARVIRSDHP
eukprot:339270-Hanusia_phi.AAC.6